MTCDAARKFFGREFSFAKLREVEATGLGAFLPVYRKLGELGLLGIALPEECGGSGGDFLDLALFAEEAGRVLAPTLQITSVVLAGQMLLAVADEAQRLRWLPALAKGEVIVAPAFAEAAEASRAPALETNADTSGGRVELRGTKRFVEGFEVATHLLVAACDPRGMPGFFMVPVASAGISATPLQRTSLELVHDLRLDRVPVQPEGVLRGDWAAWLAALDAAKIIVAAWAIGAARAALEMAVAYAKERRQFDRPIGSFQSLQHRLADAAMSLEQATALVRYSAWLQSSAGACPREAAMARLVAGKAMRVVTFAATLTFGGYGFMEEFDVQLFFRRAKQLEHMVEGPALQRELIAAEDTDDGIRIF